MRATQRDFERALEAAQLDRKAGEPPHVRNSRPGFSSRASRRPGGRRQHEEKPPCSGAAVVFTSGPSASPTARSRPSPCSSSSRQRSRSRTACPRAAAVAVPGVHALLGALAIPGAADRVDLGAHEQVHHLSEHRPEPARRSLHLLAQPLDSVDAGRGGHRSPAQRRRRIGLARSSVFFRSGTRVALTRSYSPTASTRTAAACDVRAIRPLAPQAG